MRHAPILPAPCSLLCKSRQAVRADGLGRLVAYWGKRKKPDFRWGKLIFCVKCGAKGEIPSEKRGRRVKFQPEKVYLALKQHKKYQLVTKTPSAG